MGQVRLCSTVTQGSGVMGAVLFSTCNFQCCSKSLLAASRLGERESGVRGICGLGQEVMNLPSDPIPLARI